MRVISISGKAGAGKDTLARVLKDKLEEQEQTVLITHYADLLKYICREFFDWDGEKDEAGRSLLQYIGTDVIRKRRPDYWVDFLIDMFTFFENCWDYVIISDCRFPNELNRLKDAGFRTTHIHIIREHKSTLNDAQLQHSSETSMDGVTPDYVVNNDGTIEDLYDRIELIVSE